MAHHRRICPFCARLTEDLSNVCIRCAGDHQGLHDLYHEILREKPQLRACTIDECFRKLWAAVKAKNK
jgi:predicted amidophosphoribosyltransferase